MTVRATPSPSTGGVKIAYQLPKPSVVTLTIFGPSGSVVRRFYEGIQTLGTHMITWDGRDESGNPVAAGVYLLRVETGAGTTTGKVVIAR